MVIIKKYYNFYWKRLDNVGTFYASTATPNNPNIYRISIKLNEKVKKNDLQESLEETLLAIPAFNVKLRKGFFWYYLEKNNAFPIVTKDQSFPVTTINNYENNYFLFKVTYYDKRINIDFSHILTDGTGALHFFETLINNYIKIRHSRKVKQDITTAAELLSQNEMDVDSFLKYYKIKINDDKIFKERSQKNYKIKTTKSNKEISKVIIGTVSLKELKSITKKRGITITAYLTAVLIYAIYEENYKYNKIDKPITICLPVNLRKFFPSYSMNNFFSSIMISVNFFNKEYSFDEILEKVTSTMNKELNKDVLLEKFKFFVKVQRNIILRFIPLFIKDIILRSINVILSDTGATTSFSNLGIVTISEEIKKYIDKVDIITYTDSFLPIRIGMCSFDDKLSIAFSSTSVDSEIEKGFFNYLTNENIEVKISASISEFDIKEDKK